MFSAGAYPPPFPVPPAVPPRPPHELSNDEFGKVPGVVDDREPANPFERQTGGPPRWDVGFLRERANSVTWQPIRLQSVTSALARRVVW